MMNRVSRPVADLPMIRRMGRTTESDGRLNLFWTASGIDFRFRGSSIAAQFTTGFSVCEQWIAVSLDGYFLIRMPLARGTSSVTFFQGMDETVTHRIRIFKEVQVMPDDPDSFMSVDSLSYQGEILAPPALDLTIEFIGDSITSGEGSLGAQSGMEFISPYLGVENNYARMTADLLNADFRCLCQSGWGVLSDYKNDPARALPLYYDQICGVTCSGRNIAAGAYAPYDFQKDPADFVVINLGTNDDGAFHGEPFTDPETGEVFRQTLDEYGRPLPADAERFEKGVYSFLKKIRSCNPHAGIIWCYGMLGDFLAHEIAAGVTAYQKETGDAEVHFLLLPPAMKDTLGARQHPGRKAHKAAAKILASYIKELRR